MHVSTMLRMEWFIKNYIGSDSNGKKLLDVGSYSVNGSYRDLVKEYNVEYVGLDIVPGPNVDVVVEDNYCWDSLENESFDYIISGQAFEHIEYPWLTIREIYKKLKWGGVVCITAPNTAPEHRYPYDCYRYFSDGLSALVKSAGLTVINVTVAGVPEHNVSSEWDSHNNDVYMIAIKQQGDMDLNSYPKLLYERRYNEAENWHLRYEFLVKWINEENRTEKLETFLKKHECNQVYIYGYGHLGKILIQEINKIKGIGLSIIDSYKDGDLDGIPFISLKNCIDIEDATTWREKFTEPRIIPKLAGLDNELMIITVLDSNRDLRLYLDSLFNEIPKYYIDEIL